MSSSPSPAETAPPDFQPVNTIELVSVKDSKIISVSVYSGRAEVTRLFKFAVKTGQNQLNIIGLPKVMDQDSLRCVEFHFPTFQREYLPMINFVQS
jgi:hypothetical protein